MSPAPPAPLQEDSGISGGTRTWPRREVARCYKVHWVLFSDAAWGSKAKHTCQPLEEEKKKNEYYDQY